MVPLLRSLAGHRAVVSALLVATIVAAAVTPARASSMVSSLRARHRDGQTWLTWRNLPGTGWTYRVYTATFPFTSLGQGAVRRLGSVTDSSAVDRRISALLGTTCTFRPDSSAAPLATSDGLFVTTPSTAGNRWYAVTAQRAGEPEDSTLFMGLNALPSPVNEYTARIRPVWQRTLSRGEDYVLWGARNATDFTQALASSENRAFHVGVVRGAPGRPMILQGHGRGGSFLNSFFGFGIPGESVLSFDDYVQSGDYATWYFGYHPAYNTEQPQTLVPVVGRVADYTDRRVMLLLDWAEAEIGHDRAAVYAAGASMGGTFAFMMAWHHPDRIAAAWAGVPMTTFNCLPDASPQMRPSMNRMWGSIDTNLPTTTGYNVYDWLNGRWLVHAFEARGSAPIIAFHGRNDDIIGWNTAAAYLCESASHHGGGYYFWDVSDHYTWGEGYWKPMHDPIFLARFRLDRSWPSFDHCSADGLVGDGSMSVGDTLGQRNGFVDYDPEVSDTPGAWQVTLSTRPLQSLGGTLAAPESLTVDVTPRRLQSFQPVLGHTVSWTATRTQDQVVVAEGQVAVDPLGLVTIPGVPVYRSGTELRLSLPATGAPAAVASPRLSMALSQNPVRGSALVRLSGLASGPLRMDLLDVNGRLVRRLHQGDAREVVTVRTDGLPPGLYWLRASQETSRASARLVVLR